MATECPVQQNTRHETAKKEGRKLGAKTGDGFKDTRGGTKSAMEFVIFFVVASCVWQIRNPLSSSRALGAMAGPKIRCMCSRLFAIGLEVFGPGLHPIVILCFGFTISWRHSKNPPRYCSYFFLSFFLSWWSEYCYSAAEVWEPRSCGNPVSNRVLYLVRIRVSASSLLLYGLL